MKYEDVQKNLDVMIMTLVCEDEVTKSKSRKERINKEVATLMKAKEAVDKQIARKVSIVNEEDREFMDFNCPVCATTLGQLYKKGRKRSIRGYIRCQYCGQALEWSGLNESKTNNRVSE